MCVKHICPLPRHIRTSLTSVAEHFLVIRCTRYWIPTYQPTCARQWDPPSLKGAWWKAEFYGDAIYYINNTLEDLIWILAEKVVPLMKSCSSSASIATTLEAWEQGVHLVTLLQKIIKNFNYLAIFACEQFLMREIVLHFRYGGLFQSSVNSKLHRNY